MLPTENTAISTTPMTSDASINSLIYGKHWASNTITYSFPETGATNFITGYPRALTTSVLGFSQQQQSVMEVAIASWSRVANLHFVEVSESATDVGIIRIAFSVEHDFSSGWGSTATALAYSPDTPPWRGDIWFNEGYYDRLTATDRANGITDYWPSYADYDFHEGSFGYHSMVHELGHALGLKHPFETSFYNSTVIDDSLDDKMHSIMSYTPDATNARAVMLSFYPTTLMVLDIQAIQAIYGANDSYNAGDTRYSYSDQEGQYYFETIWDGGGSNTLAYSGATDSRIDLREGHGSQLGNRVNAEGWNGILGTIDNVWVAYGVAINTFVGTGSASSTVTCNDNGNAIACGSGNDTIIAGGGADTVDGGSGLDSVEYGVACTVTVSGSTLLVQDGNCTDRLSNVERIGFGDSGLAFDLDGQAGDIACLIAAAWGTDRLADADLVGLGLQAMGGGMSLEDLTGAVVQSPLFSGVAGPLGNEDFIATVFANLTLRAPTEGEFSELLPLLDAMSQAQLLDLAVASPLNLHNVELLGLSGTGLAYQL